LRSLFESSSDLTGKRILWDSVKNTLRINFNPSTPLHLHTSALISLYRAAIKKLGVDNNIAISSAASVVDVYYYGALSAG